MTKASRNEETGDREEAERETEIEMVRVNS